MTSHSNLTAAEEYYKAMGGKNIEALEKYLHPKVKFIAPLAKMEGKDTVLEATRKFSEFFKTLKIRSKFSTSEQAMIVYDLDCPLGNISSVSLMTFQNGLITEIELFYDARPFEKRP